MALFDFSRNMVPSLLVRSGKRNGGITSYYLMSTLCFRYIGILLKCVSGAAENVKFSLMFIGYVSFYCISVQIMQFPVLDFELDQYDSESF